MHVLRPPFSLHNNSHNSEFLLQSSYWKSSYWKSLRDFSPLLTDSNVLPEALKLIFTNVLHAALVSKSLNFAQLHLLYYRILVRPNFARFREGCVCVPKQEGSFTSQEQRTIIMSTILDRNVPEENQRKFCQKFARWLEEGVRSTSQNVICAIIRASWGFGALLFERVHKATTNCEFFNNKHVFGVVRNSTGSGTISRFYRNVEKSVGCSCGRFYSWKRRFLETRFVVCEITCTL